MPPRKPSTRDAPATRVSSRRTGAKPASTTDELANELATMQISRPSRSVGKAKAAISTVDLANQLANRLQITEQQTPEEQRIAAMRTVNECSQKLSGLLHAKTSAKPTRIRVQKETSPEELAVTARACLTRLRMANGGDLDVERAASSIVGKLLVLDMSVQASELLDDMHSPLFGAELSEQGNPKIPAALSRCQRFLASPTASSYHMDPAKLTIVATYLQHATATYALILFSPASLTAAAQVSTASNDSLSPDRILESWTHTLCGAGSVLAWFPHLRQTLPVASLDALVTRVYSGLVRASAAHSAEFPRTIFALRLYALRCLLCASPSASQVRPATVWDQTTKFCASFLQRTRRAAATRGGATTDGRWALDAVGQFVRDAQKREDVKEFISDKAFIGFCECWADFATQAADFSELSRITSLMKASPAAEASTSTDSDSSRAQQSSIMETNGRQSSRFTGDADSLARDGVDVCATFVQACSYLDDMMSPSSPCKDSEPDIRVLIEAVDSVQRSRQLILLFNGDDDDEGAGTRSRTGAKVRRALDQLRRTAVKCIDSAEKTRCTTAVRSQVSDLLSTVLDVLEDGLKQRPTAEFLSAALDTLFALARETLDPTKPATYGPAYNLLSRALALLGTAPVLHCTGKGKSAVPAVPSPPVEIGDAARANYLRCISGAFHNVSAALYQAGRYAAAVDFLRQGAVLGAEALSLHELNDAVEGSPEKEADGRSAAWDQLREQVHRRWELLGVCCSKSGKRADAYEAFMQCIRAFPFTESSFVQLAQTSGIKSLFDGSPTNRQLGNVIDRMTHLGTADLLLSPAEIPFAVKTCQETSKNAVAGPPLSSRILGAILERQIEGLEGRQWKENPREATRALLLALLDVYTADMFPVRRARTLVRCLDYAYHSTPEGGVFSGMDHVAMGREVHALLSRESLGEDIGLAYLRPQYLAHSRLWLVQHLHKDGDAHGTGDMVRYAQEACQILQSRLNVRFDAKDHADKQSPPKAVKKGAKNAVTRTITRRGTTAPKAAPAKSSKKVLAPPVTPKNRKALEPLSINGINTASLRASLEATKSLASSMDESVPTVTLLESTAQLLGLLGHVQAKIQLLNVMRVISEQQMPNAIDVYMRACSEVAYEYVKLGKTHKAGSIYNHAYSRLDNIGVSPETRVAFMLRYAESLAQTEDVTKSSTSYCQALALLDSINDEEKMNLPTAQRVILRASRLERAALACNVYAAIQLCRDDPTASLNGLLQALRLWTRAAASVSRLVPSVQPKEAVILDPFAMVETKDGTPRSEYQSARPGPFPMSGLPRVSSLNGLEWRLADGTLATLFALTQLYYARGSAREADYFAEQAQELAESINAPAMRSRALARRAEIHLHLGCVAEAHAFLLDAVESVKDIPGMDAANICRLNGNHSELTMTKTDAQRLYVEATTMLEEWQKTFVTVDSFAVTNHGVPSHSSQPPSATSEIVAPELLSSILRHHIWLLRDEASDQLVALLQMLTAMSTSAANKAEDNGLLARLTLHSTYDRFREDMFLSSLTESPISLPLGMSSDGTVPLSPATQEILVMLKRTEELFCSHLAVAYRRGAAPHVRNTAVSLALIQALQSSLGQASTRDSTILAARLLDTSTAITLRRELIEVVNAKFLDVRAADDNRWPLIMASGAPLPPAEVAAPQQRDRRRLRFDRDEDDTDDCTDDNMELKSYWQSVKAKYNDSTIDPSDLQSSQIDLLPENWIVVSVSVAEDKSSMFVCRQAAHREPLLFCLPFKGKRESDDEKQPGLDEALDELKEIIRLSDEVTRSAVSMRKDDKKARSAWWAQRSMLDKRLKELLDDIEFCWLGAFKTIFSWPTKASSESLAALRARIDEIFKRSLLFLDKKQATNTHLDDALLESFATLSPKCRDEELEDLVYFILDLYQFHGVPVARAEVDADQVAVELRMALEEHAARVGAEGAAADDGTHMFLVLDKNVQAIPWESIPILRGKSVSRIPDIGFLVDRLDFERYRRMAAGVDVEAGLIDRAEVDPRRTYFMLNPSGDLANTEERLGAWVRDMKTVGWQGIVGRAPSEQEFLDALARKDIVVYFGHGGGEQYVRSHKIRHLPRCAATMLWGCSSGALREMGAFDRTGTPYHYMLAGCPTLVANLWDVTDKDLDKLSQRVFDRLHLDVNGLKEWAVGSARPKTSLVTAVAESRDVCKLKYLTGAATVVYGIPFYL